MSNNNLTAVFGRRKYCFPRYEFVLICDVQEDKVHLEILFDDPWTGSDNNLHRYSTVVTNESLKNTGISLFNFVQSLDFAYDEDEEAYCIDFTEKRNPPHMTMELYTRENGETFASVNLYPDNHST